MSINFTVIYFGIREDVIDMDAIKQDIETYIMQLIKNSDLYIGPFLLEAQDGMSIYIYNDFLWVCWHSTKGNAGVTRNSQYLPLHCC